jgi:hypothetical protein
MFTLIKIDFNFIIFSNKATQCIEKSVEQRNRTIK